MANLKKLLHQHEWVKGAVNYDEDLHFSSYYIRGSCAAATAPLYPGYSSVVAFYERFNETYYLLKQECLQTATAIVSKALIQPKWLPAIVQKIRTCSDALAGIFPAEISSSSLARMSPGALLALYRRHDRQNRELYKVARLPEALDRGVSYFTRYLQEHLRKSGVAESDCAEVFDVLSKPTVPSVLAEEIGEFDGIVKFARRSLGRSLPSIGGPGRARMMLEPVLARKLDAHLRKWQFLPYHGYGRREMATLDHYLARLLEQLRDPNALGDCSGLVQRGKQAAKDRRELLQRLKIDPAHAALFNIYPEIGAVKLYRRSAQLRNFYFLDMLLAEIARRLDVSEWTVRCMLPEEIMEAIESGHGVTREISQRVEGCAFAILDGKEGIITGKAVAEIRGLLQPQQSPGGDGQTLQGVIACRGKVSGHCRVIIRADDRKEKLPKGSIIVSESTDPDLVPLLRAASGVLTEQGGVTSHAAIICRELEIPTIIGIQGLLDRVRDGDWVEMDADHGTVRIEPRGVGIDEVASPPPAGAVGNKAHNLGVVRSLGFRVPQFVVLDYRRVESVATQPASLSSRELIERTLGELGVYNGDLLAVRSSSVAEDGENSSGAGTYRSFLNIGRDQLAATFRDFVRQNRLRYNGAGYAGSVIVQRMIEADCGGVCLTRDDRTGAGEGMIIELAPGGNSRITDGTVRPDRLVIDRVTGDILQEDRHGDALSRYPIDLPAMVRQFLSLECRFGKPLDIEWALVGRELYILQARPIVHGRDRAAAT